jgi:hypothetical protein
MTRPKPLYGYECGVCEQWFADIPGWVDHVCHPHDDGDEEE